MSYNRTNGVNFTIDNDDERKVVIKFINDKILKHNIFDCVGLSTTRKRITGCVCTDPTGRTREFKVVGQFPILRIQDPSSSYILGEAAFPTEKQFIIASFQKKEKKEKHTTPVVTDVEMKTQEPESPATVQETESHPVVNEVSPSEVVTEEHEEQSDETDSVPSIRKTRRPRR